MKRVEAMESTVKTTLSIPQSQGTSPAIAHGHRRRGVTVMVAVTKVLSVVVMVLVPGGLLIAAAYVLARLVTQQMKLEQGPQGGHHVWMAIRMKNLRQSGSTTTERQAAP